MMKILKNSRGDTIIEVLIAIVVLTAVFGGAYITANASAKKINDASEKNQALEYAQGEVEDLRARGATDLSGGIPSQFCYTVPPVTFNSGSVCGFYNSPQGYEAQIQASSSGVCAPTCPDGTDQFVITVYWNGLFSATEKVQLFYRLEI